MATLIYSSTSSGKTQRCDATCHKARHTKCVCICGGRYHGSSHRAGGVEAYVREFGSAVLLAMGIDETLIPGLSAAIEEQAAGRGRAVRLPVCQPDARQLPLPYPKQETA